MRISKLTSLALLAVAPVATADVASFGPGKGKLTGTLQTMGENGIVEWKSPCSEAPLRLRGEKLESVEFSTSPGELKPDPIQITLSNGDIIPATRVGGLEDGKLITETAVAGNLSLPKAAMASAQFGITSRKILYSGFENIRDWTTGIGEPDNWQRRSNSLESSGSSIAARDCELPQNFVLNFELSWDTRSPSYSIGFADSLNKDPRKQNRYNFNFDASGIRITRMAPGDSRSRTLAQWQRRPSSFTKKSFNVELKVDRTNRRMELLIDGESEGVVVDTLDELPEPDGTGISIRCRSHSGKQSIGPLTISELNDTRTRHLAEKRGDPSLDCLITTDDDRWSGQLLSMKGTAAEPLMIFKPSFTEENWEIPEKQISTLFFANFPFKGGPGGEPAYLIEFHGKGRLSANTCVINGDLVEIVHPLLGTMQLQRKSIKLLSRIRG